ncbi:Ankyrin repeat and KH domain-containing protein 1 [Colletotrichum siamense]|uniref:Ankyrin repeat and KH domain-containing protein 1 n=1 Tax=Colletotrichum siamense TaxID=690259 RepID=UPI0018728949|nr:Ankyrin repeat and KH domain-containing protein 1 [Colletotrichum siamense]KAF5491863.1 Ankyrin repeat and KH domain-containing protein 1 [Colletotrichum siamense]
MSDPFSIASGVVGIVSLGLEVVKGLHEYCSTLKDQSADIARVHDSLLRLHDLLGNLRKQLDARRFRSDDVIILACIEGRILQCKECIEELKKVADKFNQSHNNGFRAALKAKVRRATYPFQRSTLQKLEGNVDSIFQQVFFSMQLLQSGDTSSIRNHVEDTRDLLKLHRANNVAQDIIKWLNAPDATTDFYMAHEKSQPGTGAWFTNGKLFNTWLEQDNSLLWLYGFAGCGKSILCSTVIQHILQRQISGQDIGVAFFFFAFDDTGKQNASALLRALILQLSGQQSNISPSSHLSCLYDSCHNSVPRNQALLDCLHRLSRSFKHTYIVIDALDESPRNEHRQDVLDVLTTMRGWVEPMIHLLATSRDEVDIRDTLNPSRDESVAVRNEASDKDIALYITQSLRNKPQLRKWKGFHGRIETTLTTQADGVFRWVECQLREIAVCPRTEEHLDKLLTSLPRTLDETYEKMLLAITPGFQDYARQMLMLLCCAKRPLTVEELIYGMAVDLGSVGSRSEDTDSEDVDSDHVGSDDHFSDYHCQVAVFKDKRMLHDADAVLEVCPGFIELYDGRDANQHKTGCVRIAHFSVQEYLKSNRIKKRERFAQYHMREQDMNTQATRICLAILNKFDDSDALQFDDSDALQVPGRTHMDWEIFARDIMLVLPWAAYALEFWPEHFRESKRIPPEAISQMLRFCPYALKFSTWISCRDRYGDFVEYNPLQYSTYYGLSSVVSVLLHEPTTNINEITGTTSLIVAAKVGNTDLVRLLLERDVDVNTSDGGALTTAASTGHVKIAKLLLDHGAEVNARSGKALDAAVEGGHLEMAKLLFDYSAEVNASGGKSLEQAVWQGNLEIVKLLVGRGAEINAGGGIALTSAANGNHLEIARLLIEGGAEINSSDGEALWHAAAEGHFEMAKLLLECGADANLRGKFGKVTALGTAKSSKKLNFIRLLLSHGAEVNNGGNGLLLHEAVVGEDEDCLRLLLEHGAEVDVASYDGKTAFLRAVEVGNEGFARLLLEKGADPNAVDKFGNTALLLAAQGGYQDLVTFLSDPSTGK